MPSTIPEKPTDSTGPSGPARRAASPLDSGVAMGALVVSALLWVVSVPEIHPTRMTDLGLTSVLPPAFFASIVLMLAGFIWTLWRIPTRFWLLCAYTLLAVLTVRATPQLVYPVPRYAWIYPHLGIVAHILHFGSVDRWSAYPMNVYSNWPGFFTVGALFARAAGYTSALTFAGLAPVLWNVAYGLLLFVLFRSESGDTRVAWVGVWIFEAGNWVGQDSFAPQGLAYLAFLAAIVVSRKWLRGGTPVWRWGGLANRVGPRGLYKHLDHIVGIEDSTGSDDRTRLAALCIVLLMCFVTITSHELTPFMTFGALLTLVLLGRFPYRWVPLVVAAGIAFWLLGPAWPFTSSESHLLVGSMFSFLTKFSPEHEEHIRYPYRPKHHRVDKSTVGSMPAHARRLWRLADVAAGQA